MDHSNKKDWESNDKHENKEKLGILKKWSDKGTLLIKLKAVLITPELSTIINESSRR